MLLRRLFRLWTLMLCVASISSLAGWNTTTMAAGSFIDVPGAHPYAAAIEDLAHRGIVAGYEGGRFGPDGVVLRQQFAKMIVATMAWDVSEDDDCTFVDVDVGGPGTLYPDNFVAVAASRGVIVGTGGRRFSPMDHLTRAQMVTMVVRAIDSLSVGPLPSPRQERSTTWARLDREHVANVRWAESEGILSGLPLPDLDPYGEATRGEVAQVLHNLASDVRYYGARGDGTSDDAAAFQAALAAARSGDTVVVPPATYRIASTVKLKSGVTLSGAGATLYMPAQPDDDALLSVSDTTGVTLLGLTLRSDDRDPHSSVHGVGGASGGVVDLTIRDLTTENLKYGVKIGSSGLSSNLVIQGWHSRKDSEGLFLGNVRGGTFTDLDLDLRPGTDLEHHIYLERGNQDLTFEGLRMTGGTGYCVHLYMGSTDPADRGKRITFRHLRLDSPTQGIVVERYDGVRFYDLVGSTRTSSAFFVIYTMTDLLVDGFDVAGTPAAFRASTKHGPIDQVTIKNGVYRQPEFMLDREVVGGLVVETVFQSPAPFSQATWTR